MKKRMFLMTVVAILSLTVSAQVTDAMVEEFSRKIDAIFDPEIKKWQPDSVTIDGEWQKIAETTLKAKEGYKYGREVLARIVPKFQQRIKLDDEKSNKIIFEAIFELQGTQKVGKINCLIKGVYKMTMTLVFKDGKYRVSVEGVTCSYKISDMGATIDVVSGEAFRKTNSESGLLQTDMKIKAGQFMQLFSTLLEKQKSSDDF